MTTLFNVNDFFALIPAKPVLKRGNPNFKAKYSDKTKVMRIPQYLENEIKNFIAIKESNQLSIAPNEKKTIIQDCVTKIDTDNYKIEIVDPTTIKVDPLRFQFKQIHNSKTGSSGSLKGVEKWDPVFAGLIQVWFDPADNQTYVVNGHNRLNLAVSLGIKSIVIQYLDCKNHLEARIKGALHNMIDGKGTIFDAAKLLKESNLTKNDLKAIGIKVSDSFLDKALNISNLETWLFDKTMLGNLEEKTAVVIGSLDKQDQKTMHDMVISYKGVLTDKALLEIKNQITLSSQSSSTSLDLFGNQEDFVNLAVHRSKVINYVETQLRRSAKIFGLVSNNKNHDILDEVVENIDSVTSCLKKDQAKLVLDIFEIEKNLTGFISDKINETVDKEIKGQSPNKVRIELLDWLILFIGNKHNFLNQLMA